jgi:hypothetical protein
MNTKNKNLIQVRTIHPKHVAQLPWNHDEKLNIAGMQILGSHEGAIILRDGEKLIRWSVTAYCQQLQSAIKPENWQAESGPAREKANSVAPLFTDEDEQNPAGVAALVTAAKEFEARCKRGEIKSIRSRAQFAAALKLLRGTK